LNNPKTTLAWKVVMILYRLLFPLFFIASLPVWLWKTRKRGGLDSRLFEKIGRYKNEKNKMLSGVFHFHSISVGETLIALKLIQAWHASDPNFKCVISIGTTTGYQVALNANLSYIHIVYAPIDIDFSVNLYLEKFKPKQIILIEAEAWPILLTKCYLKKIPVSIVNARLSQRSEKRYQTFRFIVKPWFSLIHHIAVQEITDIDRFASFGVDRKKITLTGSVKFDPLNTLPTNPPADFLAIINTFQKSKVILAASTHIGEEALIGKALKDSDALFICVPRHAERRHEVKTDLEAIGYEVILRTKFSQPSYNKKLCFVIDTTGELRDWTSFADLVIVGKSFLGLGGQNPCEAIITNKPIIFGSHMENFEPLASSLVNAGGAIRIDNNEDLTNIIDEVINNPRKIDKLTKNAYSVLESHNGATQRTIELLKNILTFDN
jgi:3-deoxy-D-manno-octulosonic-acid transferase